jgi:hypothetical protein
MTPMTPGISNGATSRLQDHLGLVASLYFQGMGQELFNFFQRLCFSFDVANL